jgi:hypothetical protein
MQTAQSHIFAIGDVNGLALLDSVAFAQARVAIETIVGKEARFDMHWVPRLHRSAGWTEKEAVAAGRDVEVLAETVGLVTDDDRSVVDPQPIKIRLVVQPETRTLLGCQVVGAKAAEIVNLAATAFRTGICYPAYSSGDGSSKRLRGACALPSEPFRSTRTMRGGWPLIKTPRGAPSASRRNTLNFFAGSAAKKCLLWAAAFQGMPRNELITPPAPPRPQPNLFKGGTVPRAVRVIHVPTPP